MLIPLPPELFDPATIGPILGAILSGLGWLAGRKKKVNHDGEDESESPDPLSHDTFEKISLERKLMFAEYKAICDEQVKIYREAMEYMQGRIKKLETENRLLEAGFDADERAERVN